MGPCPKKVNPGQVVRNLHESGCPSRNRSDNHDWETEKEVETLMVTIPTVNEPNLMVMRIYDDDVHTVERASTG